MNVLSNGHWRGIPIPFLVIGGVFFLALLLWTPASRVARRVASDHRHRWTAQEHRAIIRFYLASRDLDPHRFEDALLKLSKELVVTRNSARMALKAIEGLADPGRTSLEASRGLREAWEDMSPRKR
jgi:hypothetical protein